MSRKLCFFEFFVSKRYVVLVDTVCKEAGKLIQSPLVGPALHLHPTGPETFFIVDGNYTFNLNGEIIEAAKGDFVFIPKNAPHKYNSGKNGGKILVTTPAGVENYFLHIAEMLLQGEVPLEYEFEYAKKNGQVFLENTGSWGHK